MVSSAILLKLPAKEVYSSKYEGRIMAN